MEKFKVKEIKVVKYEKGFEIDKFDIRTIEIGKITDKVLLIYGEIFSPRNFEVEAEVDDDIIIQIDPIRYNGNEFEYGNKSLIIVIEAEDKDQFKKEFGSCLALPLFTGRGTFNIIIISYKRYCKILDRAYKVIENKVIS